MFYIIAVTNDTLPFTVDVRFAGAVIQQFGTVAAAQEMADALNRTMDTFRRDRYVAPAFVR